MFVHRLCSGQYTQVPQDACCNKTLVKDQESVFSIHPRRGRLLDYASLVVLILVSGFIGLAIGRYGQTWGPQSMLKDIVPQGLRLHWQVQTCADKRIAVPVGLSSETFRYNDSFAQPPPTSGGAEPFWDSLIPSELFLRFT